MSLMTWNDPLYSELGTLDFPRPLDYPVGSRWLSRYPLFPAGGSLSTAAGAAITPLRCSVEMLEGAGGNLQVRAELPGVAKEDIDVSIVGDSLVIQAEKKEEKRQDVGTFHHAERYYGKVRRSIALPYDVDKAAGAVKASFTNGVLSLELQRSKEAASSRKRIEIS